MKFKHTAWQLLFRNTFPSLQKHRFISFDVIIGNLLCIQLVGLADIL